MPKPYISELRTWRSTVLIGRLREPMTFRKIFLVALAATTIFKLYLAAMTSGTIDVPGFERHLENIRAFGIGVYHTAGIFNTPFNHPPPVIYYLKSIGWLADSTNISFGFWLRLLPTLADIGSALTIYRLMKPNYSLIALVLSPAAILVSGYHGNTDSIMIWFVVLAVYLIETGRFGWAGMAFGMSLCVKIMPLCFVPVFFLYSKRRASFFAMASLTVMALWLPYFIQDPKGIASNLFGYQSIYGHWGLTLLSFLTFRETPRYLHDPYDVQGTHAAFAQFLKFASVGGILLASWWFRRRPLLAQCGFIVAIVLTLAPGFGTQYLIWLVPFVPAVGLRPSVYYHATSGIYLYAVYTCHEVSVCVPQPIFALLSFICWLSVVLVLRRFFFEPTKNVLIHDLKDYPLR
jgi:Glycosyltransferase family 87